MCVSDDRGSIVSASVVPKEKLLCGYIQIDGEMATCSHKAHRTKQTELVRSGQTVVCPKLDAQHHS